MSPWQLRRAARIVRQGGIVAYPTEAVWGLGCDPANADAVTRLLALKRRPALKGLIVIAADLGQLARWIGPLDRVQRAELERRGRRPVTWLVPAAPATPHRLSGRHHTLAVRITDHPIAAALCRAAGRALVSTSANPAGRPPARSALAVRRYFAAQLDALVPGPLGGARRPSEIRDLASGRIMRRG